MSNLRFYEELGFVDLKDFRGDGVFIFSRDPDDWGWVLSSLRDAVQAWSFDRRAGHLSYRGKLIYDENNQLRPVTALLTPLKDLPMHGVYCC